MRFLLPFLLGLQAASAGVRILRGETVLDDSSMEITVDLPGAVDTSRAALLISHSIDASSPADIFVQAGFNGPDRLQFRRKGDQGRALIRWQVLEFSGNVRVQRGTALVHEQTDVPIKAVDTTRSFAWIGIRAEGGYYDSDEAITVEIIAPDRLRLRSEDYYGALNPVEVLWQVVEYGASRVQRVEAGLEPSELSSTVPIHAVDPKRSLLLGSLSATDFRSPATIPTSRILPDGDGVELTRLQADTSHMQFAGYVVEFLDGTTVRHGLLRFRPGELELTVPAGLGMERGASWLPGQLSRQGTGGSVSDNDPSIGRVWFAHGLKGNAFVFTRSLGGALAVLPYQIATFAPMPAVLEEPADLPVEVGDSAVFRFRASHVLKYQWYEKGGVPVPGAADSVLLLPDVQVSQDGHAVFCRATNGTDTVQSRVAVLSVGGVRPSRPRAEPAQAVFTDSLEVTLSADPPAAAIHYTLNGPAPSINSRLYRGSIILRETATLRAIAILGSEWSEVLEAAYTKVEPPPKAGTPTARIEIDSSENLVTVILSTETPNSAIHYTEDGSQPDSTSTRYTRPVPVRSELTIKAVAVAEGHAPSDVFARTFKPLADRPDGEDGILLAPDSLVEIEPGYRLENRGDKAGTAHILLVAADSVDAQGFKDVAGGFVLTPAAGSDFAPLHAVREKGGDKSLYRAGGDGKAAIVTHGDAARLAVSGLYFWGKDEEAPRIVLERESLIQDDTTEVFIRIIDNTSNPQVRLERMDSREEIPVEVGPQQGLLRQVFRMPDGEVAPAGLRLTVGDGWLTAHFPADTAAGHYFPALRYRNARSPAVWNLGKPDQHWDFIGLPLAFPSGLNLQQVRRLNKLVDLRAMVWDGSRGDYAAFPAGQALRPGLALWLAAPEFRDGLVLDLAQNLADTGKPVPVTLRPGWNQVANPHLKPMYWPVSWSSPAANSSSTVKGLHGFEVSSLGGSYVESDMLKPWKGYFAYYYGAGDTTVHMLPRPPNPSTAAAKRGAGAGSERVFLALAPQGGSAVRLGALPSALPRIGREDEPLPPQPLKGRGRSFALREGRRLATDVVPFSPGEVLRWTVVHQAETAAGAGLEVRWTALPDGYAALAISPSRGMLYALNQGMRLSAGGRGDTLEILAGPAGRLEGLPELDGLLRRVPGFSFRTVRSKQGWLARLHLPAAAEVRLSLWDASGRRLAFRNWGLLPEGRYLLPLSPHTESHSRSWPRGKTYCLLELEATTGDGLPRRHVTSLPLPRTR